MHIIMLILLQLAIRPREATVAVGVPQVSSS